MGGTAGAGEVCLPADEAGQPYTGAARIGASTRRMTSVWMTSRQELHGACLQSWTVRDWRRHPGQAEALDLLMEIQGLCAASP